MIMSDKNQFSKLSLQVLHQFVTIEVYAEQVGLTMKKGHLKPDPVKGTKWSKCKFILKLSRLFLL